MEPEEWQMYKALRRQYLKSRRNGTLVDKAVTLSEIWNAATNPSLLRTEAEHNQCRRVARACMSTIRAFGLPVAELSNGTLTVIESF